MTVETEVANLTTAVDNLTSAVNVKKATLDASVANASSSADSALDYKIAAAVSAASAELQRSASEAAAAYAATSSALAQTYHISGRNAVNGVMPTFLADFSGQVIDFSNRISSDETWGLGTMKNSAGTIQWNPHNLLKSSEDFSDSNWTKTDTTVTSNAATAPDGTITADKISHDDTTAEISQNVTSVNGALYEGALFFKYIDHQWVTIQLDGNKCWVDIQNGVIGTDNITGTEITALSDSWYMVSAPRTSVGTTFTFTVTLASGDNSSTETSGTSAYIWGAHLYENGLGGMAKVPESDRALAALEYYVPNKAVVTGPNLVSNGTFDSNTNGWTDESELSGSTSWDASGQISLNNPAASSTEEGRVYQVITTEVGAAYKLTFEKDGSGGASIVQAGTNGSRSAYYQSDNDVLPSAAHFVATTTITYITLRNFNNVTPALVDNITVTKVDRDPTAARYLPRRENHEYINGSWVKGLLVEPDGATNLVTESNLGNFTGKNGTIALNAAVGLDGKSTAATFVEDTATGLHQTQDLTITGDESETYTASIVIKPLAGSADRDLVLMVFENTAVTDYFSVEVDTSTWTITGTNASAGAQVDTATLVPEGDGKYRVSVTGIPKVGGGNSALRMTTRLKETGNANYTGDGVSGFSLEAVQLEAGSTPSSLIPTYGSAVSRGAETTTIPASVMDSLGLFNTVAVDGTELVTNGGFDTDTDWTKGTGWTISGGTANCDGTQTSNADAAQPLTMQDGNVYVISADVTVTAGKFRFAVYDGASSNSPTLDETGRLVWHYTAQRDNDTFVLRGDTTFVGSVDNISVKEIHRRGIGVQMHGYMTYADDNGLSVEWFRQHIDNNNRLRVRLDTTGANTGYPIFQQTSGGTNDEVAGATDSYSPGINVPFKIAGRFLDNALQGAADGTATTEDTTPVGLPDLSGVDLEVAYSGPALHITKFNIFAENIKASDGTFKMNQTFLERASV